MLFLSAAAQAAQPDCVALAMVLVLAVIVAVMALRKRSASKKPAQAEPASIPAASAPKGPDAPGSAGRVKIHSVEPKTAAMLMAITADKMGKPLNELRFISIKEVKQS